MGTLSPYIVAIASSWLIAQGTKYIISSVRSKTIKRNIRQLYLSGNMPSAHSATVASLLVVIGVQEGMGSAVFGLATLFCAIVMYDSFMVRRSSGEQGKAIEAMLAESKSNIRVPRIAKGHTPLEVLVGALVGAIVGFITAYLIN